MSSYKVSFGLKKRVRTPGASAIYLSPMPDFYDFDGQDPIEDGISRVRISRVRSTNATI
jgi:hypothetical protein